MSFKLINFYLMVFHQEVGDFDLLEALRLAKAEYMEGWDTSFSLDRYSFTFYSYFGEYWADMYKVSNNKLIFRITPYGWHKYED